jgi:hypothetical protein
MVLGYALIDRMIERKVDLFSFGQLRAFIELNALLLCGQDDQAILPQLFIEGNHRTGALVMSYIQARDGKPPFVLTVPHAEPFFEWSTLFSTQGKSGFFLRRQMRRLRHQFAVFLITQADPRFLRARRD